MNDIVRLWPYLSLAARWEDDRNPNNEDKKDFIRTTLEEWHPGSVHHLEIYHIPIGSKGNGSDTSYLAELGKGEDRHIIISHLGTDNKQGWVSNVFGTLLGFFKPYYNMNPAFGMAGHSVYNMFRQWFDCHPHAKQLPIYNVMHSRGTRGYGMSLFFAQINMIFTKNFGYCTAPIFTKKGIRLCEKYGLDKRSVNVFNKGDIVDNTGFFKFKHCGGILELDVNEEWKMSTLPIASHAYSAVTHNLMETYKDDMQAVNYLRSRSFVDET